MPRFLRCALAAAILVVGLSVGGCGDLWDRIQQRPALVFTPAALPPGQVGASYEVSVTVSRNSTPVGGFSTSDGTLPPGLTIDQVRLKHVVRVHGTPTTPGTYRFTIQCWCLGTNTSGQSGRHAYVIEVR